MRHLFVMPDVHIGLLLRMVRRYKYVFRGSIHRTDRIDLLQLGLPSEGLPKPQRLRLRLGFFVVCLIHRLWRMCGECSVWMVRRYEHML
jgi:hypothetical protein